MPLVLLYVLIVFGVIAGTYLAVESKFPPFYKPRKWLITRLDPRDEYGSKVGEAPLGGFGRSIGYLLGCSWCTSVWMSGVVIYLTDREISVPLPWLVAGMAMVCTGTFSQWKAWRHQEYAINVLKETLIEADVKQRGFRIPEED